MSAVNGKWRMEQPCPNCPFSESAAGRALRRSLAAGRMAEIKADLRRSEYFTCHKTTDTTGNGTNLLCAGALEWQNAQGISSNYQRVCENLDWIAQERARRASTSGHAAESPSTHIDAKTMSPKQTGERSPS